MIMIYIMCYVNVTILPRTKRVHIRSNAAIANNFLLSLYSNWFRLSKHWSKRVEAILCLAANLETKSISIPALGTGTNIVVL